MYFIWVARGLYSSMITMFTFVYDKENGHQQDNSLYVYIFTRDEASTKKKYSSKYRVLTVLKVLE